MTLSVLNTKIIYTGNGQTTQWDIPFPFLDKEDVYVYKIDARGVPLRLTNDYELDEVYHTITYPIQGNDLSPLSAQEKLLIIRHTPFTQTSAFQEQQILDPKVLEKDLDKAMMVTQELSEQLSRCVQFPLEYQSADTDLTAYLAQINEQAAAIEEYAQICANADPLPSQTNQSGKFLTTNGTETSWATVDALPSQTGQSGKFLTTNGSNASWDNVVIPLADESTIENNSGILTSVAVKDQGSANAIKTWTGTKAQYDAIESKDANTLYHVTDETTASIGAYLVETYHNTTEWYRVWSDGWCEQGGEINGNQTVSFSKSFADTNYQVMATYIGSSTGGDEININKSSASGMYINATSSKTVMWQAKGYIS